MHAPQQCSETFGDLRNRVTAGEGDGQEHRAVGVLPRLDPAARRIGTTRVRRKGGGELVQESDAAFDEPCERLGEEQNVVGQIFLGSTAFIERVRATIEAEPRSPAIPRAQREAGRPPFSTVIATVAEAGGTTAEAIAKERGGEYRMLVAYLARTEGLLRLGDIASGLGLRSEGTVSALVSRCVRALKKKSALAALAERCRAPLRAHPPPLYKLPKPLTWI